MFLQNKFFALDEIINFERDYSRVLYTLGDGEGATLINLNLWIFFELPQVLLRPMLLLIFRFFSRARNSFPKFIFQRATVIQITMELNTENMLNTVAVKDIVM